MPLKNLKKIIIDYHFKNFNFYKAETASLNDSELINYVFSKYEDLKYYFLASSFSNRINDKDRENFYFVKGLQKIILDEQNKK